MKLFGLLGDPNEKEVKRLRAIVDRVEALEPEIQPLSDGELRAKTDAFRQRLQDIETLDDILPEAFAVAREMIRRITNERAFDVQLMGAVALHEGKISELKTGEGKTLVATLPLYLNALEGGGAHLVTVNDYLAKRDSQWYGKALNALGLSVGVLQHDSAFLYSPEEVSTTPNMEHLLPCHRREAYMADVTYGTNHEFGFDYLRDNMAVDREHQVQNSRLHYAIVDEVDNILIDEARTPLIISGPAAESTEIYKSFSRLVPMLERETDFTVDERLRAISLTESGMEKLERGLGIKNIYAPENFRLTRYMEAALKAHILYQRDKDYVVKDGEVVIVDDFTGRLMFGRRWSDGLHQAVEAKEGVKIQQESITYATITLQNYFRLYDKLAGMTGTAQTEAEEFFKIYKLEVVTIPTHNPMIRHDQPDLIYRSAPSKFKAVAKEVEELNQKGQPVLVGTVSIENSEYLSDLLKRRGIEHQVLNAKQHEREAPIIAQAGRKGAVTIATNMAGRGTDIILGGRPEGRDREEWLNEHNEVIEAGGLRVIGTERHESRRIDNQLRGRSGRQGDPGSSRFYVSLEDEIMRRFAPDWLGGLLSKLGMDEETPLESGMVSKAIEQSQTKVEGHNFDIRKHVVDYDDVMNTQRDVIYRERDKVLDRADLKQNVLEMIEEELNLLVDTHIPDRHDDWDIETLIEEVNAIFRLPPELSPHALEDMTRDTLREALIDAAHAAYEAREADYGSEVMRQLERLVMLRIIDSLWVEHLTAVEEMREGIGLAAYGQRDPLVQYKHEARDMWSQLLENIRNRIVRTILHVEISRQAPPPPPPPPSTDGLRETGGEEPSSTPYAGAAATKVATGKKVGRNDPCPCGSGLKYKKCHGRTA